jgi:hypothetical protein|nr:MAG TPA: Endonuclease [Caudoviricetes sp.]
MKKFNNRETVVDGIAFDSSKEARRYWELKLMERAGRISDLQRQVTYILIPTQRAEGTEVYKRGPNKGQRKPGEVLEKECRYVADFVYTRDGKTIVEDVKGYKQGGAYKVFVIKRKLMLERYGIQIQEV